jgi:hypothetical protein
MTGVSMADVLGAHWFSPLDYAYCLCGADLSPDKAIGVHEALAAHQAAVLAAAGFGHIATAIDDAAEQEDS